MFLPIRKIIGVSLFMGLALLSVAQGFLHAEGKNIVNGAGENVVLRGIGTGNWMLMEGYMMKTEGHLGTQHEIRTKLNKMIGETKTNEFFSYWLQNHFTKTDVDSMKAWGFNSVRVAMHYKWFTLPIEDEVVAGNNTWIFTGFKMIDNLLDWCEANEMYLILDLHGAPGGQGANADISDYDPTKPSLWESDLNKAKTVALWKELANRYSNEPWIGGYDLINETNWTFPEGNNSQMRELYGQITQAIREVDTNHIIFIEGNSFANDHSGLTPPWDENLVYSFHKYWSGTSATDLDWIIKLRDEHNVPLWLGESGENSNSWFTELIALCENNNIGWSWWPVKKNSINNVLNVSINQAYEDLVRYWKGESATAPSAYETFDAIMQWAENHKIENCKVQYDVIDAMIRQPHTDEVKPFSNHKLTEPIYFSEFDYGKNGIAYYDKVVGHYGGNWKAWNNGWGMRNDGVDIEACKDTGEPTNGYNVGWTEADEWMQYSLTADSTAIYKLEVRHASGASGSKFRIEVNGADVTGELSLPGTGGWQSWQTATFDNIVVPSGDIKIKYVISEGESNLSYFKLSEPKSAKDIDFKVLSAKLSADGFEIHLGLNKNITSEEITAGEFIVSVDGGSIPVLSVQKHQALSNVLIVKHNTQLFSDNEIKVSYAGTSVSSDSKQLLSFTDQVVENNLPITHAIPGKIEAEDYRVNNGFGLEDCTDSNLGKNTSYAAEGKYLEYSVHVSRTGTYRLDYRVSTQHSGSEIIFQVEQEGAFASVDTFEFTATGGWQNWETQSSEVYLKEGYYNVRLLVKQGEHNLNWFQLDLLTSSKKNRQTSDFRIYPNPASEVLHINFAEYGNERLMLKVVNILGSIVLNKTVQKETRIDLPLSELVNGVYILCVESSSGVESKRFIISK